MAKIGLDYGHGTDTFPPSKGVYNGGKAYHEHDFNTKLGLKVKDLLKKQGHTIIEGQPAQKKDVPLITRTNLYNREKVDLVWSIHANAGGGTGRCAFYWGTSAQSKKLAELYVDEVKKAGYSTHGDGLHAGERGSWTNLHINRETNMTAVLTENGFMDTESDFKLIFGSKQEEYTDKMARIHVKAIQRFLNKDFKDSDIKPEKPKKETPAKKDSIWTDISGDWTGQTLKHGHKGKPVTQLQKSLGVIADGMFGPDTEEAVKKAQKKAGITVDGLAGKATYKALNKTTSKPASVKKAETQGIQKWIGTKADGHDGPNTQKALVKKYQDELNKQFKAGLKVDGLWGPATHKATVNIRPGAKGNLTRILQSALFLAGYTQVGTPDGDFGKNTEKAVRAFQKDKGLTVDAVAGKATIKALFA